MFLHCFKCCADTLGDIRSFWQALTPSRDTKTPTSWSTCLQEEICAEGGAGVGGAKSSARREWTSWRTSERVGRSLQDNNKLHGKEGGWVCMSYRLMWYLTVDESVLFLWELKASDWVKTRLESVSWKCFIYLLINPN